MCLFKKKMILILPRKSNIKHMLQGLWLRSITHCELTNESIVYLKNRLNNISYFLPYSSYSAVDFRQLKILAHGFHQHLLKKYTCKEVNIFSTDTVIDCGAFVGGFTVAASIAGAKKVLSIEPSSKNFNCLKLNLEFHGIDNAVPLNIALGETNGTAKLNLSSSGCDNSLIEPDCGSLRIHEVVAVKTLETIIRENDINPRHLYLKIEAEGFEPEILKGIGNIRPRVVVVDVTAERDGKSPRYEIEQILKDYKYQEFIHTDRCIFAMRKADS
jgi:FkbM family methyltransferase